MIKIEQREDKKTVNARELHELLESKTRFNDWINSRIEKYKYIKGEDYISLTEKLVSGNNASSISYYLSIEMAKEISMVENNERGREVRKYFIECEKKFKGGISLPTSFSEALRLAADQAEQIERDKPKVIAYDKFMQADNYQYIGDVAKLLGYGRNTFFKMLREKKILNAYNTPYQPYAKYFKITEKPIWKGDKYENELVIHVYSDGVDYLSKIFGGK